MRITLCLALVLLVATSACSSSESEDIYGVWLTPDNSNYMEFNEDDTWTFTHKEDPERIRGFGPFTFDGELLTLSTDLGSRTCSRMTGTYEASITPEGNLEVTDVEDPCGPRVVEFRGVRPNIDLPHHTGTLVPYSP